MYAFSCVLLERISSISQLDIRLESLCIFLLVFYFSSAQFSYVLHGLLRDTDNQFELPHRLGQRSIPPQLMRIFMTSLVICELAAFATLFMGLLRAIL